LRSLPSAFPPHFFTSACTDDDSAVHNAFPDGRYACDDSAEYNGVPRVGDDPQ
jgi:hypothetical protein